MKQIFCNPKEFKISHMGQKINFSKSSFPCSIDGEIDDLLQMGNSSRYIQLILYDMVNELVQDTGDCTLGGIKFLQTPSDIIIPDASDIYKSLLVKIYEQLANNSNLVNSEIFNYISNDVKIIAFSGISDIVNKQIVNYLENGRDLFDDNVKIAMLTLLWVMLNRYVYSIDDKPLKVYDIIKEDYVDVWLPVGITLIAGPSQSGKSTLLDAIRANNLVLNFGMGEPDYFAYNNTDVINRVLSENTNWTKHRARLIIDSMTYALTARAGETAGAGGISLEFIDRLGEVNNILMQRGRSVVIVINTSAKNGVDDLYVALGGRVSAIIYPAFNVLGDYHISSRLKDDRQLSSFRVHHKIKKVTQQDEVLSDKLFNKNIDIKHIKGEDISDSRGDFGKKSIDIKEFIKIF